jgi:hypothetical protein
MARATFVAGNAMLLLDDRQLTRVDLGKGTEELLPMPAKNLLQITEGGRWRAYTSAEFPEIRAVSQDGQQRSFESVPVLQHLSLSPDGKWLAIQGRDRFRILRVADGRVLCDHIADDRYPASSRIQWSADSRRGATAGFMYTYVWSMDPPGRIVRLRYHGLVSAFMRFAFSADGRQLAAQSNASSGAGFWPDLDAVLQTFP